MAALMSLRTKIIKINSSCQVLHRYYHSTLSNVVFHRRIFIGSCFRQNENNSNICKYSCVSEAVKPPFTISTINSRQLSYKGTNGKIINVIQGMLHDNSRAELSFLITFMDHFKNPDVDMTHSQAKLLMSCTGSILVKCTPERRHKMYTTAWELIRKKLNGLMTTHLYNSSIRARLENEQIVNPAEELQLMKEQYNITANRMTHELLIAAYCEQGNVEGATTILEYMKANDILVNEGILNSLIRAHLRNRNVEEAMAIFDVMRDLHIVPSVHAYQEILNYHAANGDCDSAQQLIDTISESENLQFNHHKYYMEMILSASKNGHDDCIETILSAMPIGSNFITDIVNLSHRLIAQNDSETAFKVFRSCNSIRNTPQPLESQRVKPLQADYFLYTMITTQQPLADITDMMLRFKSEGIPFVGDYNGMIQNACNECDLDYTIELMNLAQNEGVEINQTFSKYFRGGDAYGVLSKLLPHLKDKNLVDVTYGSVYRSLIMHNESDKTIIQHLQDMGCPSYVIEACIFLGFLHQGKFSEASEMATPGLVNFHIGRFLKKEAIVGFRKNENWEELTDVLQKLGSNRQVSGCNGIILRESLKDLKEELQVERVKYWQQKNVSLHKYDFHIDYPSVQMEIDRLISLTTKSGMKVNPHRTQVLDSSISELEKMSKAREFAGKTHSIKKRLFIKYVVTKQYEKAVDLYNDLIEAGFTPDFEMSKFHCILEIRHKGNLDAAFNILEKMQSLYPAMDDPVYFAGVYFPIASKQLQENNCAGALSTLQSWSALSGGTDKTSNKIRREDCNELWLSAVSLGGSKTLLEILSIIDKSHTSSRGNFRTYLMSAVEILMEHCDMEEVVSFLQECRSTYNYIPHCNDVLLKLISENDTQNLQTVVDMIGDLYGEDEEINQLIIAFIEAGKVRQARALIKDKNAKAKMRCISAQATRIRKLQKVDVLLEMLASMSDMRHIDLDVIIHRIIQTYCDQHKFDAAVDMLSSYEEYNITPRPRVLYELNDILLANNKPVPFKLPERQTEK